MNDFRNDLGNAMEQLSAGRDVVSSAKIRAAAERPERKISAKRIFATAAAVCGVMICGVSVAAAAGFIDFDAVFGTQIIVNDSELASSLVGTVKNFKYKVSDSDYKIEIKGVTGDNTNMVAVAEISRVDGEPVAEHFVNPTDEGQFVPLNENVKITNVDGGYGYSIDHRANGADSIKFFIDLYFTDGIDGREITFKGKNLYPVSAYTDFEHNNKNEAVFTEYIKYAENGEKSGGKNVPKDLNDILALDLEWEFSFTYIQSDKSAEIKSLDAPMESFPISLEVRELKTKKEFVCELTAQPSHIEAGSTGGRVDFVYEVTGYEFDTDYITDLNDSAEVYVIMSDGKLIRSCFDGGSYFPDGDICRCSFDLTYWDVYDYKIFINADDIKAISINGTVYELK